MKIHFLVISIYCLLFISCSKQTGQEQVSENQIQEMRKTAKDFLTGLKSVLIREIQSGGIVNAVNVCSDTAQIFTNKFGLERDVFVRRVSFKNRNKNNYPDDFESKVLTKFELMKRNGSLNETSEDVQIVTEQGFKYLKYMKPIFVQAECLNCHGKDDQIMESVSEILKNKYPKDKAYDYSVGDLRGAVVIKKLIE